MKRCPLCNKETPDERKYCPHDGSLLVEVARPDKGGLAKDGPSKGTPPQSPSAEPAAKLSIQMSDGSLREVPLLETEINIGRATENAIILSDPSVSRRHALLRRRGGQYLILDTNSSSGVFVNGQRVGPQGQTLSQGDVIAIGGATLKFSAQPDLPPPKPVRQPPAPVEPQMRRPSNQPVPGRQVPDPKPAYKAPAYDRPAYDVGRDGELSPPEDSLGRMREAEQGNLRKIIIDGRYELEAKLAQRSNGTVYRARRILLGDRVAIRILRPELVKDRNAYEAFRRQAQIAARIHHPNSIQIYDFGSSPEGAVYVVEELVSGRTLRNLLNERGGLTLSRIVGILNQICSAAHAAHLNGIVLRDIKPESIFVEQGADGKELIKVGGYGLAKADPSISGGMTMADQVMALGTPEYMSPEQWLDRPLDSRSDVYSLGVILFEMLTGSVPFEAQRPDEIGQLHLTALVPDITEIGRPDLDEGIAAVVNRALSKDPSFRQPTALQLAAEFRAVSGAAGGFVGALINKAAGRAPVITPQAPAAVPAGEAALPSVVAQVEPKGQGTLNRVVFALMVEAFLSRVSGGLIKTAVPLYALLVFGLDITAIMALVLIQNIVPLLLRPLFGTLADKYGKKRIFMISLSIRSIVGLLYAVASLPMLFIISLVRGIADSAKGPSASAMIADNTDERNIAKAYSLYTTTKSTSGGIGEALGAFLLVLLIIFFAGTRTVTANVAVLDEVAATGEPIEVILKSPEEVAEDQTLPPTEAHPEPRRVASIEQREMQLSQVPIDDLPKVVEEAMLKRVLVAIFAAATILSAFSILLVQIFVKEKRSKKKDKSAKSAILRRPAGPLQPMPNVWSFALLGAALTAPAYMVTGEFFVVLAVKLQVTPYALGWIKLVAETLIPLIFGPSFGWLADRIGAGKVIALRSIANLGTSVLFWITPWFMGTALLGVMMGLARSVDEIGKAAFKPTWGAIAAKVSSFNLATRSRTMGIMEGGVDASDLTFPVLAGLLLQYFSLGALMAVRAVLAVLAEIYAYFIMRKYKV
ncbi:MAG TPA: MFS transporter [Blastocatellia bacterium]|nr:MFS transporter [Blastocatellia bacterium]